MNYNTSNFSRGFAQIVYESQYDKKFSQSYYLVSFEGDFQIIDNYFLTSNGNDISVYKILSNGTIDQIGNYNEGNCFIGYPLKDGKYLLNGEYNSSTSGFSDLVLYKGKNKIKVISENISRIVKTFMVTCGMYDASGEFALKVGIPAKSGVGGGIMASVPRRMGIGVFGPALDKKGNSIGGLKVLEDLSRELELNIF